MGSAAAQGRAKTSNGAMGWKLAASKTQELEVLLLKPYLTRSITSRVLESQLPLKIFNLMFTFTDKNNHLTVSWGGVDVIKPFNQYLV